MSQGRPTRLGRAVVSSMWVTAVDRDSMTQDARPLVWGAVVIVTDVTPAFPRMCSEPHVTCLVPSGQMCFVRASGLEQ